MLQWFSCQILLLKLFLPYFLSVGTVMLVIWNPALWCTFLSIFTCKQEQTNLRGVLKVRVFVLDFPEFAFKIVTESSTCKSGKRCLLHTFSGVFPHLHNFANIKSCKTRELCLDCGARWTTIYLSICRTEQNHKIYFLITTILSSCLCFKLFLSFSMYCWAPVTDPSF